MQIQDIEFLRITFDIANQAREKGNHPFGALLVDETGRVILEAENTVVTSQDCTGHAETNLVRIASKKYDSDFLAKCTLYASTEPCPMCSGAIFWSNIRRVVFGLSGENLYNMVSEESEEVLEFSPQNLFKHGKKKIEVIGPLLEDEARKVHKDFWTDDQK
jgi:tRNA(Arg) A34 adenosine deaminase TadA